MVSRRRQRRRLVARLAAGASLEDALEQVGATRARNLLLAGAGLEAVGRANRLIFGGGIQAMVETGLRSDALAAAAQAFRRHAHSTRRVLLRAGTALLYPAAIAAVLAITARRPMAEAAGDPQGSDVLRAVPADPGLLIRAAWIVVGLAAAYWLLLLVRPGLLRLVPWLGSVCARAETAAVAGAASELIRSGLEPKAAVAEGAALLGVEGNLLIDELPASASMLSMVATYGPMHVSGAIDRLRATLRLLGVAVIVGLIALYVQNMGIFA